jgi:ParB family transcriptional regulator, chromosome partitioning protein
LARLRASLSRFGVVKPITLYGDGTLVAGHRRTKGLKANGTPTVPALMMPLHVSM